MISKTIEIALKGGLEARPAAVFVQIASQYKSDIFVTYNDKKVSGKSIMGMMCLSLAKGESVEVSADGEDEEEAIKNIENYLTAEDN